jgi:hypothetical protein
VGEFKSKVVFCLLFTGRKDSFAAGLSPIFINVFYVAGLGFWRQAELGFWRQAKLFGFVGEFKS